MTRNRRGATLVFALAVMLAVSVACASMLAVSLTATQSAYAQQEQEQGYLASVGASNVVKRLFDTSSEEAVTLLAGLSRQGDNKQDLEITLDSGDTDKDKKINNALASKLTLMKDENDKVTITVNAANASGAYQTSLTVPVRTVLFYIGDASGKSEYYQITYPANYGRDAGGNLRNDVMQVILDDLLASYKTTYPIPAEQMTGMTAEERAEYEAGYYESAWKPLANGQNAPRPAGESVSGEETIVSRYLVKWLNGDNSVLYQENYWSVDALPTLPADKIPVKEPDENFLYTFSEWSGDPTTPPESVTTYTPVFTSADKYTLIFRNGEKAIEKYFPNNFPSEGDFTHDGSLTFTEYPNRFPPGYNPYPDEIDLPTKTSESEVYEYVPVWVLTVPETEGGSTRTYTPEFVIKAKQSYTIQWMNGEETLKTATMTADTIGEPAYSGETPTKEDYTFTGWGNARMEGSTKIYEAQFEPSAIDP